MEDPWQWAVWARRQDGQWQFQAYPGTTRSVRIIPKPGTRVTEVSVAAVDRSNGHRTVMFTESGNFAASGFRHKSIDFGALAGKTFDLEFRFDSDSSVTNEGGGLWMDEVKLTADTSIPPGTITGKLFNDANGNRLKDSTEGVFAGWTVYLDQNRNGVKDTGERSTTSDASGNYTFSNLSPGTYYVEEVVPAGYAQTSPGTAGLSSGSGFKINVNFTDNTLTAAQKTAFTTPPRAGRSSSSATCRT